LRLEKIISSVFSGIFFARVILALIENYYALFIPQIFSRDIRAFIENFFARCFPDICCSPYSCDYSKLFFVFFLAIFYRYEKKNFRTFFPVHFLLAILSCL